MTSFPPATPEIPVKSVNKAVAYYVHHLGFSLDWGGEEGGIAGVSRGECRLFITNPTFRQDHGNTGPTLFWLNLNSKDEVDQLYDSWKASRAQLLSHPEDKPWNLREFFARDIDGNLIRVFYDFNHDL